MIVYLFFNRFKEAMFVEELLNGTSYPTRLLNPTSTKAC
jgi:hypothetical protein